MKHITSKLLSLLLTLAMLLSMVPAAYAAGDYESNIESEPTSYVMVGGISGFENQGFESFEAAYNAIKPKLEVLCDDDALGQGVADADKFDALFTDKDANGNATLTYTIGGNVTYDETGLAHLLTMGRSSSHYSNGRHLINFKFVGADANRGATLVVNSDITLPYEWWGEKIAASISFENLTITGSAPSGLYTYQQFFEGIDFSVNDCTLSGIKIYNCANVGGSYRITNSTLDGTSAAANAYAIHLQGNETAPLTITISNNEISGYDRGINIDQATANATISGNTISINDKNRSCIQLTKLAETEITYNTLNLTDGNAITLHENLPAGSKINFTGNAVSGTGYLIYDNTSNEIALTYGENNVAETVDTTKGVYGGATKDVSDAVSKAVNGDTTEPTGVAKIGNTYYATLKEAINAANTGDTIVLLTDVVLGSSSQTLYSTATDKKSVHNLTFDLNGHKITSSSTSQTVTASRDGLVIKNGTIENTANSTSHGAIYATFSTVGTHSLTLENVTVIAKDTGIYAVTANGNATVTIGDQTVINAKTGIDVVGAVYNTNRTYTGSLTLNVSGGKVAGTKDGIHVEGPAKKNIAATVTVNVTGGEVSSITTNSSSTSNLPANVNITGGTVTGELKNAAADVITISGGTFKGSITNLDTNGTITISGGTFSSAVKEEYCADGYVPKDNDDGTYGVEAYTPIEVWTGYTGTKVASYDTIAAAVENLGENKWIVVAKDYTLTDNFTIPEGVYLDVANGATLTVNDGVTLTVAADAKRLGVRTGATLVNNGTILVCGSNTTNGFAMLYGTFSGNALTVPEDCFLDNNGKNFFATAESDAVYEITFSDGSVKKTADSANIKGGNVTQIKLLGDVTKGGWTLDNSSVGPEVTLDLNGHTLSYDGANPYYATLNVYTKVTIKNGTVKYTGSKRGAIDLVGQGDLTIESDVVVDGGDAYGIFTSGTSKLTVNGTVKANGNYAIAGNGSETAGNIDSTDVTINDGAVVSAPKGLAIYHPQLGTVTVNGGEISGHTGIEMCAGKLVVNDGSITSTGDNWDAAGSQNAILDGAAISIINRNYPGGVPTAEINGGTIKATGNGAQTVKAYDYTNNAVAEWTAAGTYVNITGGTFSSIPSNMKDLCAAGYTCAQNDDDSYTVRAAAYVAEYNGTKYESLQEAIDAASQKNGGQTEVKLLTNVTITETVVFAKMYSAGSVLLNLGGYTLTGKNCRALQINKGNLYLENGTVTSTGIVNSSSVIRIGSNEDAYSGISPMLYMRNSAKVLAPDSYGVTIFGSKTVSEKLTVASNASIEATGPSPAISGNGDKAFHVDGKGTQITITGNAVVSATNNYAIYHPDNGTLNIQGNATISGKGGIQMCSGTLKIIGSPKIETLGKADHETGAAGPIYDIAAISAANRSYPGGAPVVTIKDTPTITTVDGENGEVIHAFSWDNTTKTESEWAEAGDCINVSGGTYNKTFNEAYLAEGCTLAAKDGMYTVEQTPVAEYNGTQYTSLAQAFTDARNSEAKATVKLLADVKVTTSLDISSPQGVTLDLDKKTLTLAGGAQLYTSKTATIKKGTIKRIDEPTSGNARDFAIQVMSGSTLLLGGTQAIQKVVLESQYGIYNVGGLLNVRYANITTDGWSIAVNDSASKTGSVVIGSIGTANITSQNGNCIGTAVNSKPNVTISKGTLTSNGTAWDAGVIYWASEGTLTITGGTFKASSAEGSTAAAVYQKNGTVKISGATTKLLGNNALVVKAGEGSTGTMVTELSGGKYSTKPDEAWVVEGKEIHETDDLYVVEGPYLVEVTLEDGTTTKFDSWFSAFTSSTAQYNNATVTLLKDIETSTVVKTFATVTIDFNGHTLTVEQPENTAETAAITLLASSARGTAHVTLKDSSEAANGGMKTVNVYGVTVKGSNTTLTIENGNYNCDTSVVQVEKPASGVATAYIKGGTFKTEDTDKRYLLNCIDEAYKAGTAVMEVTGGTFYGFDPSENPEGEGTTYVKVGYVVKKNGNNIYTVEESTAEAQIVGTQSFGTLTDMLAQSANGQTVALVNDATVNNWYFAVAPGKTIDLNGNKLTVTGKLYSFGKVIDSTEGEGLLSVTDMAGSQLPKDNGYLPIKDGDGYRLYSYTCIGSQNNSGLKNGAVTFAFSVTMSETAWAKIATDDNSVKVLYRATWGENKKNEVILRFTDSKLDNVGGAAKTYYFTMSVGGLDALNGMALTMTPEIECAFFVNTMASATYNP